MAYRKSLMAGIVASTASMGAIFGVPFLFALGLKIKYSASLKPGDSVYFEWHVHFWPVFLTALLAFALGFGWKFRKTTMLPSSH